MVACPMMLAYVVIDALMGCLGRRRDVRANALESAILTIAVVAVA